MEVPKYLPGTHLKARLLKNWGPVETATLTQMRSGYWELANPAPGDHETAGHAGWLSMGYALTLNVSGCSCYSRRGCNHLNPTAVSVTTDRGTRHYASAALRWFYEAEIAQVEEQCEREIARRPMVEARARKAELVRDRYGNKVGPMYIPDRVRKANVTKANRSIPESVTRWEESEDMRSLIRVA